MIKNLVVGLKGPARAYIWMANSDTRGSMLVWLSKWIESERVRMSVSGEWVSLSCQPDCNGEMFDRNSPRTMLSKVV